MTTAGKIQDWNWMEMFSQIAVKTDSLETTKQNLLSSVLTRPKSYQQFLFTRASNTEHDHWPPPSPLANAVRPRCYCASRGLSNLRALVTHLSKKSRELAEAFLGVDEERRYKKHIGECVQFTPTSQVTGSSNVFSERSLWRPCLAPEHPEQH